MLKNHLFLGKRKKEQESRGGEGGLDGEIQENEGERESSVPETKAFSPREWCGGWVLIQVMRSGASAAQQTLTAEAASVLKQSLSLAARRGHGQVTPLHVAATLLSSRGSLLKRACLKSHPNQPSHPHPLHGRALELCFSVALNRLPTSPPLLHGHPSLSNALIAALKRAQAHQRRGCIEQQQQQQHQQPLLTIKVELEQLIISILDDPSVSRVMREAGFSSTSIKNNIEDCSVSSVFQCYSNNNGGVFSSPCSPDNFPPEIIHPTSFWPTHFLSYSSGHNPLLFSHPKKIPISQISDSAHFKDDVTLVFDILMAKKRRNTVVVGDSFSITESFMSELMRKIKRGEAPNELKSVKIVEFPLTPVSLKFMKKEEVKTMITELKKNVDSLTSRGVGVIIYAGDLKWVVEGGGDQISDYNQVDHLVAEIESLVSNNGGSKVWLMASSSYQVYMRSQMRQPPLETQWALQVVSVPSGGLSLSLHASSVEKDSRNANVETRPFTTSKEKQEKLTCRVDCSLNYEGEIQHLKLNQQKQLPLWLQPREIESPARDEHVRRLNRLSHSLHQSNERTIGKNLSNDSSYPWRSTSNHTMLNDSNSIHSRINLSQRSFNARFRRQQSCTIDFNFGNETKGDEDVEVSIKSLKNLEDKAVKTTLALGSSLFCDSNNSMVEQKRDSKLRKDLVCTVLMENVPWQSETISSIAEVLINSELSKQGAWILIHGNDSVGKMRLATAIADISFGSVDFLLHLNSRKEMEGTLRSENLNKALRRNEKLVILIEDADLTDKQFVKFLADGFESGNCREQNQKGKGFGQAIFIVNKDDARDCEDTKNNKISSVQMILKVKRSFGAINPEDKRKADWYLPNKNKRSRKFEIEEESPKSFSRQSSFNTLDLNLKAEENEEIDEKPGELSPISSDLTLETPTDSHSANGLLESIENRFTFNRKHHQNQEIKEIIISKLKKASEEIIGKQKWDQFSIEEEVVEDIAVGFGSFCNSSFEKWVQEIFQTSLNKCRYGGIEGVEIRLCLDGNQNSLLEKRFLGSCLPNNIKVAFLD